MPRTTRLRPTLSSVPKAQRNSNSARRLPIGAEVLARGGVEFRVWAPRHRQVDVVLDPEGPGSITIALTHEGDGYFSGTADGAAPGTRYGFRLGGEGRAYPDPASRFQPDGPHGPSEVIDPAF